MKNKPAALLVTRKKQLVEKSIMAGAAGFVVVARLFFYELKMLLKMIVDKTLLSCIHHVICMINISVVCFLLVFYRVHGDLHVPGT